RFDEALRLLHVAPAHRRRIRAQRLVEQGLTRTDLGVRAGTECEQGGEGESGRAATHGGLLVGRRGNCAATRATRQAGARAGASATNCASSVAASLPSGSGTRQCTVTRALPRAANAD